MTDALNSVIAQLSDESASAGSIQGGYGYSPYGEAVAVGPDSISTNASTKNPIGYTSRENDQTGLMFYRARYYDPVLKRFISSDPIRMMGDSILMGMWRGIRSPRLIRQDWCLRFSGVIKVKPMQSLAIKQG